MRDQSKENREKIDAELANPGSEMRRIQNHPAVQKDPELGIRLKYQDRIHNAATEAEKNRLAHELGRALQAYRETGVVPT